MTALLCVGLICAIAAAQERDPAQACLQSLAEHPALAPLKGKFPFYDYRSQSLSLLANDERPTDAEKQALERWAMEADRCHAQGEAARLRQPAGVSALLGQYALTRKALAADLFAGKITYGDFGRAMALAETRLSDDLARAERTPAGSWERPLPTASGNPPPSEPLPQAPSLPPPLPLQPSLPTDCLYSEGKGIVCHKRQL